MVRSAQDEKSPLIRLADRYSGIFTVITLLNYCVCLYYFRFDLIRALAVLAHRHTLSFNIATPIAL